MISKSSKRNNNNQSEEKRNQLVVNLLKLEAVISDIDVSVHLLDPCKVGMEINLLQRFESESHQSSSDRDARPPED